MQGIKLCEKNLRKKQFNIIKKLDFIAFENISEKQKHDW